MANVGGWRSQNESINYPFKETASLPFSPEFLADLQIIVVNSTGETVFMSEVSRSGNLLACTVSQGSTVVGSFQFDLSGLGGQVADVKDPREIKIGIAIAGNLSEKALSGFALDDNTYTASQTEIEGSVLTFLPADIVTAIAVGGSAYSGRIVFLEGDGIIIQKQGNSEIMFSAIGEELFSECCDSSLSDPIKSINMVVPDANGGFFIEPEVFSEPIHEKDLRQVLRVDKLSNGLKFYLES